MPRKQHTHKYWLRHTLSNPVWACALDNCNHFMPPHLTPLVEGRMSICWSCDMQFKLDSDSMRADDGKPLCHGCRLTTGRLTEVDKIQTMIEPEVEIANFGALGDMPVCKQCRKHPASRYNDKGFCVACNIGL